MKSASVRATQPPMTLERCKELFTYDPLTGDFHWRVEKVAFRGIKPGCKAGYIHGNRGYIAISADGKRYPAHRVAWLYVYGEFPNGQIDHIDGRKGNNRIANLRVCTQSENMQNRVSVGKNNTSGYLGVSWHKAAGKWRATIGLGGKTKNLGGFDTKEEAYHAYLSAKGAYHPFQTLDLRKSIGESHE